METPERRPKQVTTDAPARQNPTEPKIANIEVPRALQRPRLLMHPDGPFSGLTNAKP